MEFIECYNGFIQKYLNKTKLNKNKLNQEGVRWKSLLEENRN